MSSSDPNAEEKSKDEKDSSDSSDSEEDDDVVGPLPPKEVQAPQEDSTKYVNVKCFEVVVKFEILRNCCSSCQMTLVANINRFSSKNCFRYFSYFDHFFLFKPIGQQRKQMTLIQMTVTMI